MIGIAAITVAITASVLGVVYIVGSVLENENDIIELSKRVARLEGEDEE